MSISATDDIRRVLARHRRMKRTAITGASVALFCLVFTVIYEQFSHGAYSPHIRLMFLFPLVGCALPALICYVTTLWRHVRRTAFNLWNSAMATLCAGCLFLGIVHISGRFTDYDRIYWLLGIALALLAVIAELAGLIRDRSSDRKEHV